MNLLKNTKFSGYEITMNKLWCYAKKNKIILPTNEPPTKSAFSQARDKLPAYVIHDLLIKSGKRFDNIYGKKYLWKGHRLLAIDGTKYTLPASPELIKKYQRQNCGYTEAHYPQATLLVLFNVESKIAYDVIIENIRANERKELKKIVNSCIDNDILIMDRGYPSYETIDFLQRKKILFLMRCPSKSTFKAVEEFIKSNQNDLITEMKNKKKKLKVRLIKTKGPEPKIYITNIFDQIKYSYDEISEVYGKRWEIEEHYKVNKELFKVESFHSKKDNGIKQEIYSQLILSNMTRMLMNEAESKNTDKDKKDEPSFKNAVIIVEEYFNEILCNNDREKLVSLFPEILKAIRRVRYKKRLNRHFPRKSHCYYSKWYTKT